MPDQSLRFSLKIPFFSFFRVAADVLPQENLVRMFAISVMTVVRVIPRAGGADQPSLLE
jgi:hypothetical protein